METTKGYYASGRYWARRSDMLYYRYVDYMVRTVAAEARSLIDVGTGGCPYLEWFDWIPERVSFDLDDPYGSESVRGLAGDFLTCDLGRRFDVCTCLQVLEHVEEPERFGRKLLEVADIALVSVPHRWKAGQTTGHLHDPVDAEKLQGWMARAPNYSIVVREPFQRIRNERLIAVYDRDPDRRFGSAEVRARKRPHGAASGGNGRVAGAVQL